jgi:putative phage-type endonuclease
MIEQRSEEWFRARLGSLGSSRVHEALAKNKSGGESAGRIRVRSDLARERMTGVFIPGYKSFAMLQGTEREPDARAAYREQLNAGKFGKTIEIEQIALVRHPRLRWAHASPDGLIGKDGILELKCPEAHTHEDTLLTQAVPDAYLKQAHWQMACTGRKWVDYVSWNPDWPEPMQLFVRRIKRDDAIIRKMETEIEVFLTEVRDRVVTHCRYYKITAVLTEPLLLEELAA